MEKIQNKSNLLFTSLKLLTDPTHFKIQASKNSKNMHAKISQLKSGILVRDQ